ncbi:MAG: 4Fe-4S binding protein [Odoribacter sp.]|nr:4Fe-4S binding protein [Odoribacter sp.]
MIKKVILSFPVDATDRSLTYDLVKLYDIRINILKAEIQAGKSGSLLVELEADEDKLEAGVQYLTECGVTVSPVSSKVSYDASRCIDCGMCASSCFSHALTIGAPDWKLHFNPEKCIACKLCLKSCPLKLFRIEFAE